MRSRHSLDRVLLLRNYHNVLWNFYRTNVNSIETTWTCGVVTLFHFSLVRLRIVILRYTYQQTGGDFQKYSANHHVITPFIITHFLYYHYVWTDIVCSRTATFMVMSAGNLTYTVELLKLATDWLWRSRDSPRHKYRRQSPTHKRQRLQSLLYNIQAWPVSYGSTELNNFYSKYV